MSESLCFTLFGVIILLMLVEPILSGTWNKWYFTTGLLMFQRRIPVISQHNNIPSCSELETRFFSERRSSLVFDQIATNTYGFREKLFEFRFVRSSSVMHGVLFLDRENGEVVVNGFSNWAIVWLPLLLLGAAAFQVISVERLAPLPAMATLAGVTLILVAPMGLAYRFQSRRFSSVATFAAQAWAGEPSGDIVEA